MGGHMVVVAVGDIMLIIITGVIVAVVVTRIMSRLLLLDSRSHRGLNRREGGVQIWVVEVIFIGGNTLLRIARRVLPTKMQVYFNKLFFPAD